MFLFFNKWTAERTVDSVRTDPDESVGLNELCRCFHLHRATLMQLHGAMHEAHEKSDAVGRRLGRIDRWTRWSKLLASHGR